MNDTTTEWAINRLAELRSEYATGNARLTELARQRDELRVAVLRVEGAIRVLEEQVAQLPLANVTELAQSAQRGERDVSVG
jgi:hypothetical protein